ncbi:MAG: Rne/Rng family ribonuclease [Opitutales bacterium]|nr:Rne/Rng family ribonuclease [Opitutales bacterium]
MKEENIEENQNSLDEELAKRPPEVAVEPISVERLNAEAKLRAKKRPLLEKIIRLLKREEGPYKELVINVEPLEKRVALLEDGLMQKFETERAGDVSMVGAIFKGKIQNLEPGLKAAFVDIGQPKNAFLHYWDIFPSATSDNSYEIVRENRSKEQKKNAALKLSNKDIPEKFPVGTDIVIQITKTQIGTKGPRVTTNIAIPGRYLVLMPYAGQCGISRKIEDKRERERIKKILRSMKVPEGMGVIVRTAGQGKRWTYFVRDLHILLNIWKQIQYKIENEPGPALLYKEPDIIERTVRDFLTEETDRILIDSKPDYENILKSVSEISHRARSKIQLYKDNIPIFERYNIEHQITQTFQRRVPLPSGGEIVVDETEALTAIDVNTGSHKGKDADGKDFILQANLEAVAESARQVRLRNIGGLIIIDTIDMKSRKDRQAVYKKLRDEMEKDKAKSQVLPISQLGIMQMTRQRHHQSNASEIYSTCPYCGGKGIVKSSRTMSVEIQRKIVAIARAIRAREGGEGEIAMLVLLHPDNLKLMQNEDYEYLINLEKAYNLKLTFRADPSYHVENFRILDPATNRVLK